MTTTPQTIAWFAQGELPVTWDALSRDARFGEDRLLAKVSLVKEDLFGEDLPVDDELIRYSRRVRAYAGKLVAIEVITAAIDFWMDMGIQVTVDSPRETKQYESRIRTLQQQKKDLIAETRRVGPLIAEDITYVRATTIGVPGLSTIDDDLLTPSPQNFPTIFGPPPLT